VFSFGFDCRRASVAHVGEAWHVQVTPVPGQWHVVTSKQTLEYVDMACFDVANTLERWRRTEGTEDSSVYREAAIFVLERGV